MKKWILCLAISASVLCTGALVKAEEQKFMLPVVTPEFKPGPGSELAASQCSLCHSSDYISTQPRFTGKVWLAEVTKMQQKYGAPIATNNIEALADYLTKNYGKETTTAAPTAKP